MPWAGRENRFSKIYKKFEKSYKKSKFSILPRFFCRNIDFEVAHMGFQAKNQKQVRLTPFPQKPGIFFVKNDHFSKTSSPCGGRHPDNLEVYHQPRTSNRFFDQKISDFTPKKALFSIFPIICSREKFSLFHF